MSNDTVLMVIGDHGMTEDGNHGGDSDEETGTVIFGITKEGSFFTEFSNLLRGEDDFLSSITFSYQTKLAEKSKFIRTV
jgi:phosphatidylinositol glycan class O